MKNMNPRLQKVLSGGLPSGARGSVLIVAVITLVVMGILGAGMVSMLGTSALHEVRANYGERAYYLAESGFMFAASMTKDVSQFWGIGQDKRLEQGLDPFIDVTSGGRFTLELTDLSEEEGYDDTAYASGNQTVDLDEPDERTLVLSLLNSEGVNLQLSKYGAFRYKGSWYRYLGYEKDIDEETATLEKISSVRTKRKVEEAGIDVDSKSYVLLARGPYLASEDWEFKYDGTIYTYESYSSNKLKDISVKDGAPVTDPATAFPAEAILTFESKTPVTITGGDEIVFAPILKVESTGEYPGGNGFFNVERTVTYIWPGGIPKAPPSVPDDEDPPPEDLYIDLDEFIENDPFGDATSTGRWITEDVGPDDNETLTVDKTTGGVRVEAVIGYMDDPNPFYVSWVNAGNFLSYDAQVKISMGIPDDNYSDGTFDGFAVPPDNSSYCGGISFRLKPVRDGIYNTGQWRQLGVSIFKTGIETTSLNDDDGIPGPLVPTGVNNYPNLQIGASYVSGDIGLYETSSGGRTKRSYYRCNGEECSVTNKGLGSDWVPYNIPMILLWERGHRNVDGDEWLAYMPLEMGGDGDIAGNTIDAEGGNLADGKLKDWSTLILRVVEAASIKVDATEVVDSLPEAGSKITGGDGEATIVKIIRDNDGKLVFLLNNIIEGFTAPEKIGLVDVLEFRERDNYIWAFFGDTDDHNQDEVATNDTRHANPWLTNAEAENPDSMDPESPNQKIFWPEKDIEDWGKILLPNGTMNDYSRLVVWAGNMNPPPGYTMHRMGGSTGSHKEANAIIRTNLRLTADYATFPSEFGLHAIGANAKYTYFDDIAVSFNRGLYTGYEDQEDFPMIPVVSF